ncbi:hypothetical protein LZV00_11130 [Pseudomonas kielensis]|uniref:hypothetical protein n=1 Tax=Pseudomonas kielensis TaxID=2762577 RepID=UPI00223FC26C|nr:hypothetical protein [Pseudomonas kielensis]UZM16218.1 hypothetical protein LZV00_11130 [Pseudomonas kielensis]
MRQLQQPAIKKFRKVKAQAVITAFIALRHGRRAARVVQQGHIIATPSKNPEDDIADSIIRSVLWQLQQPAIKLQLASAPILFKVKELKEINEMFLSGLGAHDNGGEKGRGSEISANESGEDDVYIQVRQLVQDKIEQEKPESKISAKLAVLNQLLVSDIASARKIVKRYSKNQESIGENADGIKDAIYIQLSLSVKKKIDEQFSVEQLSVGLSERIWKKINKFLPDIAESFAASVVALDKTILAAEQQSRNFSEIKGLAEEAHLSATKVKEYISTKSTLLTGKPLDDNSRGARLAKHWANFAQERHRGDWRAPDAGRVFTSLKKKWLA